MLAIIQSLLPMLVWDIGDRSRHCRCPASYTPDTLLFLSYVRTIPWFSELSELCECLSCDDGIQFLFFLLFVTLHLSRVARITWNCSVKRSALQLLFTWMWPCAVRSWPQCDSRSTFMTFENVYLKQHNALLRFFICYESISVIRHSTDAMPRVNSAHTMSTLGRGNGVCILWATETYKYVTRVAWFHCIRHYFLMWRSCFYAALERWPIYLLMGGAHRTVSVYYLCVLSVARLAFDDHNCQKGRPTLIIANVLACGRHNTKHNMLSLLS